MPTTQLIPGPAGNLELVLETPDGWDASQPVTICCHPHPLHGGSLQNKVVHILAKSFLHLGAQVVRFNFRGVGQSEGEFADGLGEQDDLLAVVQWCRQNWPDATLWLAGFSFGAFVAIMAHEKIAPQRLVLVAPPTNQTRLFHCGRARGGSMLADRHFYLHKSAFALAIRRVGQVALSRTYIRQELSF